MKHRLIGEILIKKGYITNEQLDEALGIQRNTDTVYKAETKRLIDKYKLELIKLGGREIPKDVIKLIKPSFARTYNIIPVAQKDDVITVALAVPRNMTILDDIRFMTSKKVKGSIASYPDISEALKKYYPLRRK